MDTGTDFQCLTEAIYHEARGESFAGQMYVAFVIRNRVESEYFPDDFCSVIKAPWQFSYNHKLNSLDMVDKKALRIAKEVSYMVLTVDRVPISEHVLYYHASYVTPAWDYDKIQMYATVGNHIFYEDL